MTPNLNLTSDVEILQIFCNPLCKPAFRRNLSFYIEEILFFKDEDSFLSKKRLTPKVKSSPSQLRFSLDKVDSSLVSIKINSAIRLLFLFAGRSGHKIMENLFAQNSRYLFYQISILNSVICYFK